MVASATAVAEVTITDVDFGGRSGGWCDFAKAKVERNLCGKLPRTVRFDCSMLGFELGTRYIVFLDEERGRSVAGSPRPRAPWRHVEPSRRTEATERSRDEVQKVIDERGCGKEPARDRDGG
jgi:hypothetical protein